ncbi:unnamed protein product [Diamesa serratosioi]
MNTFECNVTPTRVRNAKSRNEDREPTLVVLGPFTPKTIVQFDEIPISKTARRLVIVENPYKENLKVTATKLPKQELNVVFEWTIIEIPASSKIQLEIVWSPVKVVSCREILQLTDNYGNKKDIAIILKSVELKKTGNRKLGSMNHPQKLKFKIKSPSPVRSVSKTTFMKKTTIYNEYIEKRAPIKEPLAPSSRTFASQNVFNCDSVNVNKFDSDFNYRDKENTPATPANASTLFDSIKFTPATETKSKSSSKLEYLSSLPTPVGISRENMVFTENTTRRKLEHDISPDVNFRKELNNKEFSHIVVRENITQTSRQILYESPKRNNVPVAFTMPLSFCHDNTDRAAFELSIDNHTELNSESSLKNEDVSNPEIQLVVTPNNSEQKSFMSKTHVLSTPPSMPIISENEAMTHCTTPEIVKLQKTFNVAKQPFETCNFNVRILSESLREISFHDNDVPVEKLRCNQGSMPNLNEMTAVTPIENNRYFFQKDQQHQQQRIQNLSMDSVVSNTDFRDMEICAQSSRFNINEVGLIPNEITKRAEFPNNVMKSLDEEIKTPPKYLSKNVMKITRESPTVRRVREEITFKSPLKKEAQLLTISPPARNRFSVDVMEMHRRDTFVGTSGKEIRANTWKHQQNHKFQVPRAPRMSTKHPQLSTLNTSGNGALISQSLTSLSTLSLVSTTSTQSMPSTPKNGREYSHMYNAESHFKTYINPDPFAASTTCDPFLSSTMYLDEKSVDCIEKQFKKWLNALVTIPADLDSEVEKVDVGKLFNEVQNKELKLAPTRELVSCKYYKTRLDSLRAAGIKLYTSEKIRIPLTKLTVNIEKKSLEIRAERMIHLDLVLQRNLLELLLCFNPLWLRIGLEVVFGVQIELNSNQDVLGLSRFIITRMFKDPYLAEKYSKYTQQKDYIENVKKFTLKKFLFVIYFLDHAKTERLIKHNPCLFVKKAPYKETNEILKKFASLVIANFGDILRHLKRLDYVLSHKQTYIDEFDYAFNNLAVDLRDGVRLNKVMEIILLRDDLTKMVRAPAISRLQKVYNVECALKALQSADYQLHGDITAKDIADGHREKTLSMLWQIIYKFRAPRFNAAAITIQKFWRHKWLMVVLERRIKNKAELRITNAVTVLQKIYRGNKSRQATKIHREQRVEATIFIQKNVRRFLIKVQYQKKLTSIVLIQNWFRRVIKVQEIRSVFIKQKKSTVIIQTWWRRQLLCKKLIAASNLIKSLKENAFVEHKILKENTIKIQRWLRSCMIVKIERRRFLELRSNIIKVQRRFRGKLLMATEQKSFQMMKQSTINVQRRYRAQVLMRHERQEFVVLKQATIKIQQKFRATIVMKQEQISYKLLQKSVITIQKRYLATLKMRQCREDYQLMRGAAITIQQQYRSVLMMRIESKTFQETRKVVINVQRQWRAQREMRRVRKSFLKLKEATIAVQQRFRANQVMNEEKTYYQKLLKCTIKLQQKFRATKLMQKDCMAFYTKQYYTTFVQRHFRAIITMRKTRGEYQRLKQSTIKIQTYFRSYLLMKSESRSFQQLRSCIITIQQRFRARKLMILKKSSFQLLRTKTVLIQRTFRSRQIMKKEREDFIRLKDAAIVLQQHYRAKKQMDLQLQVYNVKKEAILKIQRYWRATIEMRIQRLKYRTEMKSIIWMQRKFRANRMMKQEVLKFNAQKASVLIIQRYFRGYQKMLIVRKQFLLMRRSVVIIQQRFRATQIMKYEMERFVIFRKSAVIIQRRFQAKIWMKNERKQFMDLKNAAIVIQQRFRANLMMKKDRENYKNMKASVITLRLQTRIRGFIARKRYQDLFTPEMIEARLRNTSARLIQASWRGFVVRRKKENRCLKAIAERLRIAKKNADSTQTLGFKLKMSINFISGKYNAMEAISVLVKLEYISRTIPSMLIDHAAFVSAFCYGLMAQAIRSEFDKQIIELCSCIILNLGRYMTTKEDAFQEQGLMTIAQMLLRWCDKDCGIFNTLCTLVWVFAHCDTKKQMIRKFMMQQDGSFVMSQIRVQVKRKENMRANSKKPIGFQSISLHKYQKDYQLLQQKQYISQYSSGFITPAMLQQCKQMPSFAPDYGVVKTKPYIFYSSVFAYDQILRILDINLR